MAHPDDTLYWESFKLVSISKPERKPAIKQPPQRQDILFIKDGLPGQLDFLDLAEETEQPK